MTVTPAPPSVTQSQSAEQRPEPPKPREYVVARDSLWTIAEKVYGDARLYRLIAEGRISLILQAPYGQVLGYRIILRSRD